MKGSEQRSAIYYIIIIILRNIIEVLYSIVISIILVSFCFLIRRQVSFSVVSSFRRRSEKTRMLSVCCKTNVVRFVAMDRRVSARIILRDGVSIFSFDFYYCII